MDIQHNASNAGEQYEAKDVGGASIEVFTAAAKAQKAADFLRGFSEEEQLADAA